MRRLLGVGLALTLAADAAAAPPRIGLVSAPAGANVGEPVTVVVSAAAAKRVTVWIRLGSTTRAFAATKRAKARYAARVTFPSAGRWTLGARSGTTSRALRTIDVRVSLHVREPFRVVDGRDGSLLVPDGRANRILRVDPTNGRTTAFLGNGASTPPVAGSDARAASVGRPLDVAVGLDGAIAIVSDEKVWRVDPRTFTLARVAADVSLVGPTGVTFAPNGDILICEYGGWVRRVDAQSGATRTIAGTGVERSTGDGGPATAAAVDRPHGLAVAADGTIYVSDSYSYRVRRIDPSGTISTFAGNGTDAGISGPTGVTVSPDGTVWVAETWASRITRLAADGAATRVASVFPSPTGIAVLGDGRVYASLIGGPDNPIGSIVRIDAATGRVMPVTR